MSKVQNCLLLRCVFKVYTTSCMMSTKEKLDHILQHVEALSKKQDIS